MDMLAVEAQLYGDPQEGEPDDDRPYSLDVAAHEDTRSVGHMDEDGHSSALEHTLGSGTAASFHASKKSGTLKKYYKKIFKANSSKAVTGSDVGGGSSYHGAHAGGGSAAGASPQPLNSPSSSAVLGPTTSKASNRSSQADDDDDGVTSQLGRGSRMSTRYDMGRADAMSEAGGGGVGSSMDRNANMGSLKNMFGSKKKKRDKQIELDAIRLEMEMLQERCCEAENALAAKEHEASALRAERQQLQESGRELVMELEEAQTALAKAQADLEHMRSLNTQVKGALQSAYSDNQALKKQLKDAEELCTAQQNSLEEAEERCRRLTESHDRLHHASLQLKAQLVTATAAAAEARAAREELLQQLSAAEAQATALQSEVESRDVRMAEMERQQAESSAQMEDMLGRLRELEGDRQQLEARGSMLRDENVELGAKVDQLLKRQSEVEEERNELRIQLQSQQHSSLEQQSNWAEQLAALALNHEQSEAKTAVLAADLRASMESSEVLKQRNDELADELGRVREAQQKKGGSPLKWRRAGSNGGATTQPQHSRTPSQAASEGGSSGADLRPINGNVALQMQQQQQQQQQNGSSSLGRTLTDDGAHATVSVTPATNDATSYAQGPLAAGRAARKQGSRFDGASKAGAAYVVHDTYSSRDSVKGGKGSSNGGSGLVGKLFGCFAPAAVMEVAH